MSSFGNVLLTPFLVFNVQNLCGYSYHSSELSYFWRSGPSVGQTYMEEEKNFVNAWTSYLGQRRHFF